MFVLPEDAGRVKWRVYNNSVHLTSPRIEQCQDVMSRLIIEQCTGKEWSLCLWLSSCTVRELEILNTPLTSSVY